MGRESNFYTTGGGEDVFVDIGNLPSSGEWFHFALRVGGTVGSFLFVLVSWVVRIGVKHAVSAYTQITADIEKVREYETKNDRILFLAGIIDENGNSTGRRCG